MKKQILLITLVMVSFISFSQTSIPGGNVYGKWTIGGSPYLVQGGIMIPKDSTLTIQPGVTINFQGWYKLSIQGRLIAVGTKTDTIIFTCADTSIGWLGIRFDNTPVTNDTSVLKYCKIQNGKATGSGNDAYGGGIYILNFSKVVISNCRIFKNYSVWHGGGIFCSYSNAIITNNTISYNSASVQYGLGGGVAIMYSNATIANNDIFNNSSRGGGGIFCSNDASVVKNNRIYNNTASNYNGGGIICGRSRALVCNNYIFNNSALNGGGGIGIDEDQGFVLTDNVIYNNSAKLGGGLHYNNSAQSKIINNTIANNKASFGGALFCLTNSNPVFYNSILWGNTADSNGSQVYLYDENSDPDFYYCDIQYGSMAFGLNNVFYKGKYLNNLNLNPSFVTPSTGSGTGLSAMVTNWSLLSNSPCINSGNPDTTGLKLPALDIIGNPRIAGNKIDMGPFEFLNCNPVFSSVKITACNSFISPSAKHTWTTGGIYNDTIANAQHCDSVITINLTIHSGSKSDTTAIACNSFTWHGNTYKLSGTYYDTLTNVSGCDSVITLHLTVTVIDTSIVQIANILIANATGATYKWADCNNGYNPIPGATNKAYTAYTTGDYAVIITQDNCIDTSKCYHIVFTGFPEKQELNTISILPNPTGSTFTIYYNNANKVVIYNSIGLVMLKKQLQSDRKSEEFNISEFKTGVYLIQIQTDRGVIYNKIIKE